MYRNKTRPLQKKLPSSSFLLSLLITLFTGNLALNTDLCASNEELKSKVATETSEDRIGSEYPYEQPRPLYAEKILPLELQKSEYHRVLNLVTVYNFINRFTITSEFGDFIVDGEDMLRLRIQEIHASAALEQIKKTKDFEKAVEHVAQGPLKGALDLINNPVDTITGIPRGVESFYSPVEEMAKGAYGDTEDSIPQEDLIGFSKMKRLFAYRLGVDVYSSNRILQKKLNSVSWAAYLSGKGLNLLKKRDTTPIRLIENERFMSKMNKYLRDYSPDDLMHINQKRLKEIGTEESVIEKFLNHSKYSPRHRTILVHALADSLDGVKNRGVLIRQALVADYEDEAFFFQRFAEMLAGYHKKVKSISEFITLRRLVAGYTIDQTIVIVLPMDYAYWDEKAESGINDYLTQVKNAGHPVSQIEILITGKCTPLAKQAIEAKGIVIREYSPEKLLSP